MEKFQLDQSSFMPLYHQLKEHIIKKSIECIVLDGSLYCLQVRCTIVSMTNIELSLSDFYSFSQVLRKKGLHSNDVDLYVKSIEASHKEAKVLNIKKCE